MYPPVDPVVVLSHDVYFAFKICLGSMHTEPVDSSL